MITVKDIILKSIDLYKQNTHLFIRYMLVLLIPTGAIAILGAIMGSTSQMVYLYGFGTTLVLYISLIIIGSLASLWISMAFIRTISNRHNNEPAKKIKEELLNIKKLIIPAILAYIIMGLIVAGGLILFIVPGIIFSVWFAFTIYNITIDENSNAIEALKNSKKLVDGRWWEVIWRLVALGLLFALIAVITQGILSWPLNYILKSMGENSFVFLFLVSLIAIINVVINLIFTPLTTAAPVILYNELKKNPLKLEKTVLPDQIETPAEPPTM
ncbi:MAG: hypothetical protein ABIJ23_02035 [Candidatus Magasanikbacteria bacterium]